MTKDKKPRTQYNWKFKENESKEFYEWFNNQDNISSSLRNMVYHIIELYGTNDILDPSIQKQFVKDSLILESLKGQQNVLNVNPNMVYVDNKANQQQHQNVDSKQQEIVQKNESDVVKKMEQNSVPKEEDSLYAEVDPNNL